MTVTRSTPRILAIPDEMVVFPAALSPTTPSRMVL
jgi:hypothetical protein